MSTPKSLIRPPLDYSLLFCDMINFHMRHNPTFPMFAYENEQSPSGTTEISFLEFGRAAHRVAHVLRPGRSGDDGQVVMIIASNDTIHYHAVQAGLNIAGLVPFLVSPRNSAAGVVDMMRKTGCSRVITLRHAHQGFIDEIRKEASDIELLVEEMPPISYAFPSLGTEVATDPFDPYPQPLVQPDLDKPAVYIHSSGSTGFPKAIPLSYRVQINLIMQPFSTGLRPLIGGRQGVMALPTFHLFGTATQLYQPLANLVTAVVFPPQAITDPHAAAVMPTSDNVLDCARKMNCALLFSVPTFVEQWAASQETVEVLKQLKWLVFGGGPLAQKVGDKLNAVGVRLASLYGGTEFGCPTVLPYESDLREGDWMWLRFGENVRWVPQGDDTYELQVLTTETYQVAKENLPDVKGWATADLFIKHPTKDLWKIVGRLDDVITLASGEKTVPIPMEAMIGSSPLLQGAVMFGRERNQVGILVEPRPQHAVDVQDDNAVAEFRNKIWPLVEEANKLAPAFSRIFKEMILIAKPEKPTLRTPKGSIQKKLTIKLYETEINSLYDAVEATYQTSNGLALPSAWTAEAVEEWLMQHARFINHGNRVDPVADLFAQGFDSLSATYFRNQIFNALRTSTDNKGAVSGISQNLVFENPTIKFLATRIASLVNEGAASSSLDSKQAHVADMNAMIEKYSAGLRGTIYTSRVNPSASNSTDPTQAVVLLTGSTGGLGSFLLSQLIESPLVTKVYAMNRPSASSIEERQQGSFLKRGLSVTLLGSKKLVYIEADTSQENCGLPHAVYEELRGSITTIIHNAWRLDFNLSLASFESNVKATRNLIDLALNSYFKQSIHFVFTSSVGSAQGWDRSKGPFPEEIQRDPSVAVGMGYGESKYVCERIIANSGLRVTSLRIGQIAGGPNGSWATTDWVPIIVKSSLALGALPDSRGVVSWLRVEDVAAAILDIAFSKESPQALNVVNPQRAPWTDIMSSIRDECTKQKLVGSEQLSTVPFMDWVGLLEKRAEAATSKDLINIPAIKLLDFFRGLAQRDEASEQSLVGETGGIAEFSTAKSQVVSKTLAQMRAVGDADARSWVKYWVSNGFFS